MVNPTWKNKIVDCGPVLKLVFMARIMKQKGYETVFDFSDYAKKNDMKVQIDFYGQINSEDKVHFNSLIQSHAENVRYCGYLSPEKITSTLMEYDIMMLPTRLYRKLTRYYSRFIYSRDPYYCNEVEICYRVY